LTHAPIIVDEDFPLPVARALRERGFSVVAAVELPPRGLADIDQLRRAARMGWVLVSHNRRDFIRLAHELRQRGEAHSGVVLLPRDLSEERLTLRTAMLLEWRASLDEPRPDTLIWNDLQQQLIGGLRLAGYTDVDVHLVLGQRLT
jgi:predicted nuclease of predicted toxin-antitoxin system